MGAWGFGITQDDTVADVVEFMTDCLKSGQSVESAASQARSNFAELESDDDDAPSLWLAIAYFQWKYGSVGETIISRVRNDIATARGLNRWFDDPSALARRKEALARFLAKLESPNPKPSRLPKSIVRKAPFRQGDCLSVQLADAFFTAALVLREDNSDPEYGKNLVVSLDYYEREPPKVEVFERREWLVLSHGNWNNQLDILWYLPSNFRKERKRISVIGNISPSIDDPKTSGRYGGWNLLGAQIPLCRAHRAVRNA